MSFQTKIETATCDNCDNEIKLDAKVVVLDPDEPEDDPEIYCSWECLANAYIYATEHATLKDFLEEKEVEESGESESASEEEEEEVEEEVEEEEEEGHCELVEQLHAKIQDLEERVKALEVAKPLG